MSTLPANHATGRKRTPGVCPGPEERRRGGSVRVLALVEQAVPDLLELPLRLGDVADVAPVESLGGNVVVVLDRHPDAGGQREGGGVMRM